MQYDERMSRVGTQDAYYLSAEKVLAVVQWLDVQAIAVAMRSMCHSQEFEPIVLRSDSYTSLVLGS